MNKQKTRPPETLKCLKSKTIMHRKLKSSHHVDLIRSTWYEVFSSLGLIVLDLVHFKVVGNQICVCPPFIFQLCTSVAKNYLRTIFVAKYEFTHFFSKNLNLCTFCRSESFVRKSLISEKFTTFLPLWPQPTLFTK